MLMVLVMCSCCSLFPEWQQGLHLQPGYEPDGNRHCVRLYRKGLMMAEVYLRLLLKNTHTQIGFAETTDMCSPLPDTVRLLGRCNSH